MRTNAIFHKGFYLKNHSLGDFQYDDVEKGSLGSFWVKLLVNFVDFQYDDVGKGSLGSFWVKLLVNFVIYFCSECKVSEKCQSRARS